MNTSSPCTNVCKLDGSGICLGCLRTLDEIARWSQMDDVEKAQVNARLDALKREIPQNHEQEIR